MKSFVIGVSIIVIYLALLITTSGIALAFVGPSHPGSIIFPMQTFMEEKIGSLYTNPSGKAEYLLSLVERRVNDLSIRAGSRYEGISIEYLGQSFDHALTAIASVDEAQSVSLRSRLVSLAVDSIEIQVQLDRSPRGNKDALNGLRAKTETIIQLSNKENKTIIVQILLPLISAGNRDINPQFVNTGILKSGLIPFPLGSKGALHDFFPLIGLHEASSCESCHGSGKYAGTPTQCIACHIFQQPLDHYNGECELCHTAISWDDIHFDHEAVTGEECQSCHVTEEPPNHFNGACSACHITENWNNVTFDHSVANAVDCANCHAVDTPSNHYSGQCSNCHNTNDWPSATFNHFGFTDCVACHSADLPANHYSGQCSACHQTSGSWRNAQFNHNGYSDCTACHGGQAPANHYPGQCSNCHNTSSWAGASFSHAGFTDCISCHQKDRPSEHEGGQCSECHNTSHWENGDDGIGTGINQSEAFWPLECSACHQTTIVMLPGVIQ